MARRSTSFRCWVERSTTSAIGPLAWPRPDHPVFSSAAISASGQSARPASALARSEGTYQLGPASTLPPAAPAWSAPSAFRAPWHSSQWATPCAR